jgi:hypothetical protein
VPRVHVSVGRGACARADVLARGAGVGGGGPWVMAAGGGGDVLQHGARAPRGRPPLPPLHCHPTTSQQDNQNNQKLFFFAPVDNMACVRRRMDEHTATLGQDCPTVRLSACPPVRLSAYPPAAQCVREMLWAAARGGRTRAAACWLHCRPVLLWLQVSRSEWPAVAKYNQVVSNRPKSNDYAKGTTCAAVLPVEYPELTTIHADSTVREYTSRASVTREGMHCGIAYTRCSVSWHCAVTYIHGVARRFARSSCVSVSGSC